MGVLAALGELPLVVCVFDPAGRVVWADGGGLALLGLPAGALRGRGLGELADRLPWLAADVARAAAGETVEASRPLGERWLACHYAPTEEAGGVRWLAVDVTRARAEERGEQERTLSLLQATLDATDDGIFTVDREGRVGFVNRRFLDMWRLDEAQMRQPDFRRRMDAVLDQLADPATYQAQAAEAYRHPERTSKLTIEFKDGRIYERYSHPQYVGGRCVGRVLSFRDVTEARRAERRVAFLGDLSARLASHLDHESRLKDAARFVVPAIADACLVFGSEDGGPRLRAAVHRDERAGGALGRLGEALAALPPGGLGDVARGEAPLHLPAGAGAWLAERLPEAAPRLAELACGSLVAVPLVARGQVLGVLMLLTAAGGRVLDGLDFEFAHHIARRVALSADNGRLYAEAERAVRARDEFLSIAAHELRTPLTALQLRVQSLLRKARDPAGAATPLGDAREIFSMIDRQTQRLGSMIRAVLDISQLAAGGFEIRRVDVDLGEVAREAVSLLDEELRRARQIVEVDAPAPVRGAWDRDRLVQVVVNLLGNAITHGRGKPIHISVERRGETARLVVRDQGNGIPPADQKKIFEKFARGPKTPRDGLGLGLYIARSIAEAHGGQLDVDSRPGAGAAFCLELPA